MKGVRSKRIPLLDLRGQYARIQNEINSAVARVIESQQFILGQEVELFEKDFASYCGAKFAVGCASGSDALLLALLATNIQPGDEVLTVPFTFFATVGEIVHAGAKPVFVDVEAGTFNIDAGRAAEIVKKHPRIRAIMPVHLFGGCADMDALTNLAKANGLIVIEDAAQAVGAEYRQRRAGSMGEAGCFSFFPSKNLGAFGDGGMITTNDEGLCQRLRALRVHGSTRKYYHEMIGYNSRLDALQAAVLNVKLRHLDTWNEARRRNAHLYRESFAELNVPVTLPVAAPYQNRHVWNQFVIRCPERDSLRRHLAENGVGTEVYYPLPLHMQPCFAGLGYKSGDFPVSERLANEVLALPVYPEILRDEVQQISAMISEFYRMGA